jgi:hypothetical protein
MIEMERDIMNRRRFAERTVLKDDTMILGVPVSQWDALVTANFVQALPTETAPPKILDLEKKASIQQAIPKHTFDPIEQIDEIASPKRMRV